MKLFNPEPHDQIQARDPYPVYLEPPKSWVWGLIIVVFFSTIGANVVFYLALGWLTR